MGIKIYPMGTYYVFVHGYLCWFNNRHFFVGIFFLLVTRLRRYVKRNRFFKFFEIFLGYPKEELMCLNHLRLITGSSIFGAGADPAHPRGLLCCLRAGAVRAIPQVLENTLCSLNPCFKLRMENSSSHAQFLSLSRWPRGCGA